MSQKKNFQTHSFLWWALSALCHVLETKETNCQANFMTSGRLEQLKCTQFFKKLPVLCGFLRFINVFTNRRYWILHGINSVQSTPFHYIFIICFNIILQFSSQFAICSGLFLLVYIASLIKHTTSDEGNKFLPALITSSFRYRSNSVFLRTFFLHSISVILQERERDTKLTEKIKALYTMHFNFR
jgi:hypothetical protein